jgi:YD repeat-containing protein
MKTITLEYLIKNKACKEAISFVKRNNLNNFPIKKLKEVKGDYSGFKEWIINELKIIKKYDDKGNMIYVKYPNGNEYHYKYDDKGNKIYEKYPSGDEYHRKYDDKGNMIYVKDPSGDEYHRKYDDKGNKIYVKYPNGDEYHYKYDDKGNKR